MIRSRRATSLVLGVALALVPLGAAGQGEPEPPPDGWLAAACAAIVPLDAALGRLADLGQASMAEDVDAMLAAVQAAAAAAEPAVDQLDAEVLAWSPGSGLVNALRSSIFGVLALENDLDDAEAVADASRLTGAVSALVQAYRWRLDSERTLTGLVEGGSGACASIELPTPTLAPETLADLFPETIGGQAVRVQSAPGSGLIETLEEPLRSDILAFIEAQGREPADLEAAVTRLGDDAQVLAVRLTGVPADVALVGLSAMLTSAFADPTTTTRTVDGVDVTILSDGPPDATDRRLYVVLSGDVIWAIRAEGETLSEILQALG